MAANKLEFREGEKDEYGFTLIKRLPLCCLDIWKFPRKKGYKICISVSDEKGRDICEVKTIEEANNKFEQWFQGL